MAVKLRLVRLGRRHRAFFRLRAGDSRIPPSGRFIEELGFVDPMEKDPAKAEVLKKERIEHWLEHGAQVSPTVSRLLQKHGISKPKTETAPATADA